MRKGNRLLLLSLAAATAFAWQANAEDTVSYDAIRAMDWTTAERQLLAGLEQSPKNVFMQLNLAWVYAQTGRKTEAAALYQEILRRDQDRVATLSANNGPSMAMLAKRGLALLD